MHKLTLYTAIPSRGANAHWMLEECQADYDLIILDAISELKTSEYLAINPMGQVPTLKHDNAIITELPAIVTYLAELFPKQNLIPIAGTPERAQYYRWTNFAINFEYAILNQWLQVPLNEQYFKSCGYGNFETTLSTLTNHLSHRKYAVSNHFTALEIPSHTPIL